MVEDGGGVRAYLRVVEDGGGVRADEGGKNGNEMNLLP